MLAQLTAKTAMRRLLHGLEYRAWLSSSSTHQSASLYNEWYRPAESKTSNTDPHHRPMVFLHGLLGNARNIKTMAKKMCDIKNVPGLLVDLTGHGRSSIHSTTGSVTFERVCSDLEITLQEQWSKQNWPPNTGFTMVGHSLGGRLALMYASEGNRKPQPTSLWLLDCVPGQPDESVLGVLNAVMLVTLRHTWRSRMELTTALIEGYELPTSIAEWLASQYDIQYQRFDFDIRAAKSIADDFGSQDYWQQLDSLLKRKMNIHLVQGGKNNAWEPALPALKERSEQYSGSFIHHVLPRAGHWVHVDDLPGLLRAFETAPNW